MADRQRRDCEWNVADERGEITWDLVPIAVLMDIRRELRKMNALLGCRNFTAIPQILRAIRRNTGHLPIPARKSAKRTRAKKKVNRAHSGSEGGRE